MSVIARLNRLFGADGKCFEVAIDHGVHHEISFLSGIENMPQVIGTIAAAGPDAILLTVGQAHLLQEVKARQRPALALRTDPTNLYGNPTPDHVFCQLITEPVDQALAWDAVSVVANLIWAPDQPDLYDQCLDNVCRLKPQCERYGMPLMVEPLAMMLDKERGGYKCDLDIGGIVALVRQAVELGADVVKADPCKNLSEYHKVVEVASPKPVLVRGGARVSDEEVLARTYALMQQGASGIVYGRNIFQHPHPEKMIQACNAIIHEGGSVSQAMSILTSAEEDIRSIPCSN